MVTALPTPPRQPSGTERTAPPADGEAQGVKDAAMVLAFVAAALLLPPVILIFAAPVLVGGVPLIVVYVFGIWAVVIVAAWLVSRRLAGLTEPPDRSGRA